MSFIDETSVASLEKSDIHISLRSKVREKRKLRQRQNLSKSSKRKLEQQPVSPLPNRVYLKITTNDIFCLQRNLHRDRMYNICWSGLYLGLGLVLSIK